MEVLLVLFNSDVSAVASTGMKVINIRAEPASTHGRYDKAFNLDREFRKLESRGHGHLEYLNSVDQLAVLVAAGSMEAMVQVGLA